jgi:hypothetical protein
LHPPIFLLTPAPAPGPSEASPERVFNDKRVKFVTLKAYEKAGGTTRRDLFSDDDTGVYIAVLPHWINRGSFPTIWAFSLPIRSDTANCSANRQIAA